MQSFIDSGRRGSKEARIAPLPARAGHFPKHLLLVAAVDRRAHKRLDMFLALGAFELNQAIVADKPVGAGSGLADCWMLDETDQLNALVHLELISGARFGFVVGSPLHRRTGVALGHNASQALANQLGGVVGAGYSPTLPRAVLCHDIGDARGRHQPASGGQPFWRSLNDLHHAAPF
jgi:hypothetical protein